MKYVLKQKLFSIGDDFNILDENNDKIYKIDGKLLTIGEKFYFEDKKGNKIFKIKKKLIRFTDTYHIEKDKKVYAKISKDMFTIFGEKFELETPYGDIKIKGNIIDYDFSFYFEKRKVATVSKKLVSIRDKYTIDIDESFPDHPLILACTMVIDMICHNDK